MTTANPSTLRLAVVQMACNASREANLDAAERLVREAASQGAQVILLPELFEGPYFPAHEREERFALAQPANDHDMLRRFAALAAELSVVLPLSFFERANQAYYNSLAMVDADGSVLGVYRKTHIPDGPGYEEKYYFSPGDTPIQAWDTRFGRIGVAICWDQWFPEVARILALQGADLILYPTAIGSEPSETGGLDTRRMWRRVMQGHAVANGVFVAAANRVGSEEVSTFYGTSFISDLQGEIMAEANDHAEAVLVADLDLVDARAFRAGFGFFRDRRPDLYGALLRRDGQTD